MEFLTCRIIVSRHAVLWRPLPISWAGHAHDAGTQRENPSTYWEVLAILCREIRGAFILRLRLPSSCERRSHAHWSWAIGECPWSYSDGERRMVWGGWRWGKKSYNCEQDNFKWVGRVDHRGHHSQNQVPGQQIIFCRMYSFINSANWICTWLSLPAPLISYVHG